MTDSDDNNYWQILLTINLKTLTNSVDRWSKGALPFDTHLSCCNFRMDSCIHIASHEILWKISALCRNLKSLKSKLPHQDPRLRVTGYHGLVITKLQPSDGGDYSCQVSEKLKPAEIVPIVSPCFVQALPGLFNSISSNLFRLTTWVLYRRSPTDYRFNNKAKKSLEVRLAHLEQFFWKISVCMNLDAFRF